MIECLMEAMKLKTIWLQSFNDLPAILDLIPADTTF